MPRIQRIVFVALTVGSIQSDQCSLRRVAMVWCDFQRIHIVPMFLFAKISFIYDGGPGPPPRGGCKTHPGYTCFRNNWVAIVLRGCPFRFGISTLLLNSLIA